MQRPLIVFEKVLSKFTHEQKRVKRHLDVPVTKAFPESSDLKLYITEIYDQGQLSSCTSNALAQAYRIHEGVQKFDLGFRPSRLYIYAKERQLEESKLTDEGAYADDGLKIMTQDGVCCEEMWPYKEEAVNQIPPACCDQDAVKHRIGEPFDLPSSTPEQLLHSIRHCIAELKVPVVLAIELYASFQSDEVAKTGVVPMPAFRNLRDKHDPVDAWIGGHESIVVGYDDKQQRAILCNSWGDSWGNKGFFTLPYAYITSPQLAYSFRAFQHIKPTKQAAQTFRGILDLGEPETPRKPEDPLAYLTGMGAEEERFDYDEGEEDDVFLASEDDD